MEKKYSRIIDFTEGSSNTDDYKICVSIRASLKELNDIIILCEKQKLNFCLRYYIGNDNKDIYEVWRERLDDTEKDLEIEVPEEGCVVAAQWKGGSRIN